MNRENRRALEKVEKQYMAKAAKGVARKATNGQWTEWILTNTIISTEHETKSLKTRTHDKRFDFWLNNEADSVGFMSQFVATTDHKSGEVTTKQSILSYYFGFADFASAYRFVEYCKSRFLMLSAYHSHCEARESQRLTHYPVEVKVRSLTAIADALEDFAKACIVRKMSKQIESAN